MSHDIDEIDVAKVLEEVEKAREWIKAHYDELRAKYEGKIFAVRGDKVVSASGHIHEVLKEVQEKGEDPLLLVLDSIPSKDVSFIL